MVSSFSVLSLLHFFHCVACLLLVSKFLYETVQNVILHGKKKRKEKITVFVWEKSIKKHWMSLYGFLEMGNEVFSTSSELFPSISQVEHPGNVFEIPSKL